MPDLLTERVATEIVPSPATDSLTSPVETSTATIEADPSRQYLAGMMAWWVLQRLQTLPPWHGDLEAAFGRSIWGEMIKSPVIWAGIQTIRFHVLSQDLNLTARIPDPQDPDDPDWQQQQEILQQSHGCLAGLDKDYKVYLYEMLDCEFQGYAIAEKSYEEIQGGERWKLTSVKVKPQEVVGFVVDPFLNVRGWVGVRPGLGGSFVLQPMFFTDGEQLKNVLPRSKCALLTYYPDKEDPRGTNLLRAEYAPWWSGIQAWGMAIQSLAQFGGASVVGTCAEDAAPAPQRDTAGNVVYDGSGNPILQYPQDVMLQQLQALVAGAAITLPFGSEVEPFFVPGALETLLRFIDTTDRQATLGILGGTRATQEAQHGSRADSGTAKDIADMVIQWGRFVCEQHTEREILKPWLELNYGPDVAEKFCPRVSLGDFATEDLAALAPAIAALEKAGFFTPSQKPFAAVRLGFPPPTPEEIEDMRNRPAAPAPTGDQEEDDGDEGDSHDLAA